MSKSIALVATGMLFLTGCCTAHHLTQWEYKTEFTSPIAIGEPQLNALGKDGWALVSCTFVPKDQNPAEYRYIFRRPLK